MLRNKPAAPRRTAERRHVEAGLFLSSSSSSSSHLFVFISQEHVNKDNIKKDNHTAPPSSTSALLPPLSILTWLLSVPEERSGIWPVDQSGWKIDGPHGQWNTFLLNEQQIIFKWKVDYLTPGAFFRNTEIPVTREIFCFSIRSRLTLRWSTFKLKTTSMSRCGLLLLLLFFQFSLF